MSQSTAGQADTTEQLAHIRDDLLPMICRFAGVYHDRGDTAALERIDQALSKLIYDEHPRPLQGDQRET